MLVKHLETLQRTSAIIISSEYTVLVSVPAKKMMEFALSQRLLAQVIIDLG